ncbi:MAG: LytTR family transcriptional regulator [SAR324 cluster bacterium]|nr:LytTR family transcriptional regulator [SAR324 cluster bacterium]MBL7034282.1 LytTR family transcriptional regulator [SAR324 cluster bacterium]
MKIKLPKTGLFHFGLPWWLAPTIFLILIHTTLRWRVLSDGALTLYFLDIFRVLLPFQILYFLLHFYLRPQLSFATSIKGSLICNLLTVLAGRRFMLPDDILSWWINWFQHFPDMLQVLPAWFVISIILTLLEVVLSMRNKLDSEMLVSATTVENLKFPEKQTDFNSASNESRILMVESIQQYKTIYRLSPDGVSEEIVRKSFEELSQDYGKSILQVHKSYMVAPDLIQRIERVERNNYLILQHIEKRIPVSRKKLEEVRALLLQ